MKTYIIHVSDAYQREVHIRKQLENKEIDFSFINQGDKKDLTPAVLEEYFAGDMKIASNATSCAYKHILAYKKISEGMDDLAMVLEDDIRFYRNYDEINEIIKEIEKRDIRKFIISLEDSNLKYIPKSEREKGIRIYPKKEARLTGAYLIDKEGANSLLKFIKDEKIEIPIDWFHTLCVDRKVIDIFWSQPVIAVQGSLDGSIKSLIGSKKYGFFRILSFKAQRLYKKLLFQMR